MKKLKINWRSKRVIFLIILILFAGWLLFTKSGKTTYQSLLILSEELPANRIRPLSLVTKKPTTETFTIPDGERQLKVDLVRPAGTKKFPLVIISPGAGAPFGQSSIARLSKALGRIGVGVAFVEVPELRDLGKTEQQHLSRVIPSLVNSFKYFQKQSYSTKIGYLGFCVGATAALDAAEEKEISSSVSFIIAFQPSFSLGASVLLTGNALKPDGSFRPYDVNVLSKTVIIRIALEKLGTGDQKILGKAFIDKQDAPLQELTSDGQTVYNYLYNRDPNKFFELFNQLPLAVKENINNLYPDPRTSQLKAKVFIFSSGADSYMSIEESDLLAKRLPASQVHYTRLESLVHMQPDQHFKIFRDLGEYAKIYSFIYSTLSFIKH